VKGGRRRGSSCSEQKVRKTPKRAANCLESLSDEAIGTWKGAVLNKLADTCQLLRQL
jgi:hypothetical protein